jgi:hypothetical protein
MNDFKNFEYGLQDMNEMTLTLTLEDDTELLCGVVAIFRVEDKEYIALQPLEQETDEVFIYRFKLMDVDESIPILENIEDDDEFELTANTFDELIDGADYKDFITDEAEHKDFIIEDNVLVEYNGDGSDVVIPEGVTGIGGFAFHECLGLKSVSIPKTVVSIGAPAFVECTGLMNITVDKDNDSYKDIDGNLYSKDGKVLVQYAIGKTDKSFTIPDGVTKVECEAFRWANNLTSVLIPNSVTTIGTEAFFNCLGLTNIEIPNSVTSIGVRSFADCYNLTHVVISNGLVDIDDEAFYRCENLSDVVIPASVKRIGQEAFWGCSSLTSVSLGEAVTSIGFRAFYACDSLKSIIVDKNNDNYKDIDGNLYSKDGKVLIQYAIGKKRNSFTIPDGVASISGSALWGCDRLSDVVIPDSVTSIGAHAFSAWNSRLSSIVIPDSVTSIGEYAFSGCNKLTNVVIGKGITNIDKWAFSRCENLTIKSYAGGYVEIYAKENNIPFEAI